MGHRDELDLAGPDASTLPVVHGVILGSVTEARFVDSVPGQSDGQGRTEDGGPQVAQQVGQPAGVVLVPVGEDDAIHALGVLAQVGEVGQHEVHAGHLEVGEHDPAVEDEDATVDLDAGAVASDLAQSTKKDHPDGGRRRLLGVPAAGEPAEAGQPRA